MPSSEGDTIIDPYHKRSVLQNGGHPLDGRSAFSKYGSLLVCSALLHADLKSRFQFLALDRVGLPPVRVVQQKHCPIRIILYYSQEACNGNMPPDLNGRWPFLKEEAVRHAALLRDYENLGPEARPRSRLDGLTIEQIRASYDAGEILPQVHLKKDKGVAKTSIPQPGDNGEGSSTGAGAQTASAQVVTSVPPPGTGSVETPTTGQRREEDDDDEDDEERPQFRKEPLANEDDELQAALSDTDADFTQIRKTERSRDVGTRSTNDIDLSEFDNTAEIRPGEIGRRAKALKKSVKEKRKDKTDEIKKAACRAMDDEIDYSVKNNRSRTAPSGQAT